MRARRTEATAAVPSRVMRADPRVYEALDLRAHSLLAGVPLHDVWVEDLPGGTPGRTLLDVRALLDAEGVSRTNPVVRFLFGLRRAIGSAFGWDDSAPSGVSQASYLAKLSVEERAASLIAPGTREGPFTVLSVTEREAISEAINATVHAFSVFALVEEASGYRFFWAIYVQPVSWITPWYMRAIDPFRRFIVYPAVLRSLRRGWADPIE